MLARNDEKLIFGTKKPQTGAENKPETVKGNIIVIKTLAMENSASALGQVWKLKKSQINANSELKSMLFL